MRVYITVSLFLFVCANICMMCVCEYICLCVYYGFYTVKPQCCIIKPEFIY